MWAIGRFDLHLAEAEFWRLTMREFIALVERLNQATRRADSRAGVLAALFANANRDPKRTRRPFTPEDFFPSLTAALPPFANGGGGAPTAEHLAGKAVAMARRFGGTIQYREHSADGGVVVTEMGV